MTLVNIYYVVIPVLSGPDHDLFLLCISDIANTALKRHRQVCIVALYLAADLVALNAAHAQTHALAQSIWLVCIVNSSSCPCVCYGCSAWRQWLV